MGSSDPSVSLPETKTYELPRSLEELRGPDHGVVVLPESVPLPSGGRDVDLGESGGAALAYRGVIAEGKVEDQVQVLNRGRLIEVWEELLLPRRARRMWERRFPELHATLKASEAG